MLVNYSTHINTKGSSQFSHTFIGASERKRHEIKMFRGIVFVAVLVTVVYTKPQQNECDKGPSYWCKNKETATKCGVAAFCNVMKSDDKIRFGEKKPVLDAPPVKVSFYYESLCPGCRQVWATQLYSTYQKLASSGIVEFEIVPYGNAQEQPYGSSWYFTCQHGPTECVGEFVYVLFQILVQFTYF